MTAKPRRAKRRPVLEAILIIEIGIAIIIAAVTTALIWKG